MSITATELKINLGKYLILAETEDIYITRNEKLLQNCLTHIRTEWILLSRCLVYFQMI